MHRKDLLKPTHMKTTAAESYIAPVLRKFKSLEDLLEDQEAGFSIEGQFRKEIDPFTVRNLFEDKVVNAFILADPGYGKSELLRQVEKAVNARGGGAMRIDLKDTTPDKILDYFSEGVIVYCFDALDEVRYDQYQGIVAQLQSFAEKYPDVSILISCRRHDAANNRSKFYQFPDFQFIKIIPFDYDRVKNYIQLAGIHDEALIQTLYHRARPVRGNLSVLSIPRYLKSVVELVRDQVVSSEQIRTWKRKDFFEGFIYTRLGETLQPNEKEITKRVLEKLALVMEIYQVNSISKDEFITFLDGVQSNVNLVFLNTCDIDTFFKRVLETRLEQGVEYIEFNNTEFQEYLAAKELDRIAGNPQAIYDLVMQPQSGNIYSNWYDVLRYLVEIRPAVILPIVEFLNHKPGHWVEDEYWGLLSAVNAEEMTESDRAKVFEYAFGYVQDNKGAFITSPRAEIAQFCVPANYALVREPIPPTDEESARRLFNQIEVIKIFAVTGLLDGEAKEKWQQLLIDFALREAYELIQKNSIIALAHFHDLELLKKIKQVSKSNKTEVKRTFIRACYRVDPNADFSVDLFLEALPEKGNCLAADGINSITARLQLLKVLGLFATDAKLLAWYIEQSMSCSSHIRWKLIDNLNADWDPRFEEPLVAILKKLLNEGFPPRSGKDQIEEKIIALLAQQNEAFICQLVDFSTVHLIYRHHEALRKILTPTHTRPFVERFLKKNPGSGSVLASHIFQPLYSIKEEQSEIKAVYEAGRVFLARQYQRWEAPPEDQSMEQWNKEREERVYFEFTQMLEPHELEPEYFDWEVFRYFLTHEETIRKYATTEDFERLKTKLTNSIARVKPETTLVEIEIKSAVRMSYSLNADLRNVQVYLRLAERLEMSESINISRQTLLALLPLHNQQDAQQVPESQVIRMLGKISAAEEDFLYQFATARKDDYLRISPIGFAEVIKFFNLRKLVPILKALVDDKELTDFERVQVFSILATSFPEKDYLEEAFTNYEKATRQILQKIAYMANETLIFVFKDEAAIQWQLQTLKNAFRPVKPQDFSPQQATWAYSVFDIRSNLFHLATLIRVLQDEKYIPHFYDLLAFAFKKLEESTEYLSHCLSLFKLITDFFLGLKERSNGYGVLLDLYQFLDQEQFKNTRHFFSKYRLQLEVEYAKLYDKPRSIQFAINKYNQVKAKNYLPIYNSRDLLLLLKRIINEDIRKFVYQEGFYKVIEYLTNPDDKIKDSKITQRAYPNEDHIQKVLAVQLENALLKKGIRETDIHREPQLLDNKRIDLLVKYGFVKPIVIEIKLLHNTEITDPEKREPYKDKLRQYLQSQNADYGIYLIFKVKTDKTNRHEQEFYNLRQEYQDIKGLEIPDFIDCTINTFKRH